MIGGSLVFGLETAAISRPACEKSLEVYARIVWVSLIANLPGSRFQELRQCQSILSMETKLSVHFFQKLIQEAYCDSSPFYNDIVIRGEHGDHLHTSLACDLGVRLVRLKATLQILVLQSEQTRVDQKATIAVFWKSSEQPCSRKMNVHQSRHGHHDGVAEPLSELMEWRDGLPQLCRW